MCLGHVGIIRNRTNGPFLVQKMHLKIDETYALLFIYCWKSEKE